MKKNSNNKAEEAVWVLWENRIKMNLEVLPNDLNFYMFKKYKTNYKNKFKFLNWDGYLIFSNNKWFLKKLNYMLRK